MVRPASDYARLGVKRKRMGLSAKNNGLFLDLSADFFDHDRLNAIIGGLVADNHAF